MSDDINHCIASGSSTEFETADDDISVLSSKSDSGSTSALLSANADCHAGIAFLFASMIDRMDELADRIVVCLLCIVVGIAFMLIAYLIVNAFIHG